MARVGAKFSRDRYDSLDAALREIERRARELEGTTRAKPVDTMLGRKFDPVQQVAARLEVHGPKIRAGVDVRGDGSAEAFTGWLRRRVVTQRGDESPYDALRRELLTR